MFSCPCCGAQTISQPGAWELCLECCWEDDPVQSADPALAGGANRDCLNDYRADYLRKRDAPKSESNRRVIRVYDLDEHSVLVGDFARLLEVVAPQDSIAAVWAIAGLPGEGFDATGEGAQQLEELARSGQRVGGWQLPYMLRDVVQIIWGEFTAFQFADPTQAWAIIRAIDSTFYEIETADSRVLERVRAAYQDVREAATRWPAVG